MATNSNASLPLQNRTAVITGATAGIGEAVARLFVENGAACVLNGRRAEKLAALKAELGAEDVATVAGDCTDDRVIQQMLDAAQHHFPGPPVTMSGHTQRVAPDIIVVNAGRGLSGSVLTSDPSQWEEMLKTNILGAAKLIRAAAERLLSDVGPLTGAAALNRPRDIVVLGSTVGRHISPFSSMYGGTKFAVNSMAEAVRRELGPKGIRVTLIEPGFVETEFQGVAGYDPKWFEDVKQRIGPPLTPLDIARTILFVVSQPPAVHLSDILIRPTRQEYP